MLPKLGWVLVAVAGAAGWGVLALHRGETISAAWLILAAVGTYRVAFRFYSRFAAIAGAGPLVGAVLAAQFGYLPGTIGGRGARTRLRHAPAALLETIRGVAGMPDRAAYLEHLRRCHPERALPTERELCEAYLRSRYPDGPSRCC